MARWEPGTARRLQQAALELFAANGYDRTTAGEVAAAVGLTERTFFRHYRDKADVLFYGQAEFERGFLDGLEAAPAGAPPLRLVAAALRSASELFPDERRPHSRARQRVIEATPALAEREGHKLAGLAATLAAAMRGRGVGELAADLAAHSCVTVFTTAFEHWIRPGQRRSMTRLTADVLRELQSVTGG